MQSKREQTRNTVPGKFSEDGIMTAEIDNEKGAA